MTCTAIWQADCDPISLLNRRGVVREKDPSTLYDPGISGAY